jgi:hypothetical protein
LRANAKAPAVAGMKDTALPSMFHVTGDKIFMILAYWLCWKALDAVCVTG